MSALVLYNGQIYSFDPALPVAQALAIHHGRVVAIGSESQVRAAIAGMPRETIDLRGQSAIPGLTDAHVHITEQGLALREARLGQAASLDQAQAIVAACAATLPPGTWLRGGGWDQTTWNHRWPHRRDLDAVCPDRPVLLSRKDGHSLWVNSLALELAGITAATPDPEGGQIQRDHEGQPTGIFIETAMELIRAAVPPHTATERLDALRAAQREALSYGLTSIHVVPATDHATGPNVLRDLQTLRAHGELTLRTLVYLAYPDLEGAIHMGLRSGLGDHWLRIGGLKLFADGSLGSESAELLSPYEGRHHSGLATIDPELLDATIRRANLHGISLAIHAIGDAANRKVLDAFERATADRRAAGSGVAPLTLPNRIEHVQLIHPDDLPRLAKLAVIASMQPIHCTSDIEAADALWGARCTHAYAWRSLHNSGATLAFGSDAPVESMNPWLGIHAATRRQRPNGFPHSGWHTEQCLDTYTAIQAYCHGPAIASGEAHVKGRLTVGSLADLVLLTADPFHGDPSELHTITAAMTIVDGKIVYER